MNNKKIKFDMELFQGYTCIGCAVVNDLAMEVEFTDDEILKMKQLVADLDEDYSPGMMPMLKDGAPDLYERMEDAARDAIFDFFVEDGIRQDYIEFDKDELRANYRKDFGTGDDEEIDEHDYNDWEYDEMQRIRCSSLKWVRARYSVDDHVDLDPMPEYTVDIPSEFLP